ncbi:MAG: hypothetical protein D6705_09860 [Deltaproteobacteria bacterium]|nr:MAG: hypothetical protein D6705_09860 [Deltaproteobacteria bacterium]
MRRRRGNGKLEHVRGHGERPGVDGRECHRIDLRRDGHGRFGAGDGHGRWKRGLDRWVGDRKHRGIDGGRIGDGVHRGEFDLRG